MKSKLLTYLLFPLFVGLLNTCKKGDEKDPFRPNTEIGANTFTFRVNGKIYDAKVGYLPSFPKISVAYNYIDNFLDNDYLFSIEGNRVYLEDNKQIRINVHYVPKEGRYKLSEFIWMGKGDYATYTDDNPGSFYYITDKENTGEIMISKLDTVNRIIAGKFSFVAKRSCPNRTCNETIVIDGQFDVKFRPNISTNYY